MILCIFDAIWCAIDDDHWLWCSSITGLWSDPCKTWPQPKTNECGVSCAVLTLPVILRATVRITVSMSSLLRTPYGHCFNTAVPVTAALLPPLNACGNASYSSWWYQSSQDKFCVPGQTINDLLQNLLQKVRGFVSAWIADHCRKHVGLCDSRMRNSCSGALLYTQQFSTDLQQIHFSCLHWYSVFIDYSLYSFVFSCHLLSFSSQCRASRSPLPPWHYVKLGAHMEPTCNIWKNTETPQSDQRMSKLLNKSK